MGVAVVAFVDFNAVKLFVRGCWEYGSKLYVAGVVSDGGEFGGVGAGCHRVV